MNVLKAPFLFLMIHFPGKWIYIAVAPAISAALVCWSLLKVFSAIPIIGSGGLFSKISAVMPIAGGFFVAALTVILSQNNSVLQSGFVGSAKPYIKGDHEPLTRQRFLALLFGYLAFSSFSLTVLISAAELFAPYLKSGVRPWAWGLFKGASVIISVFWSTQMFGCSLIGLFYLTDRLYRSPQVSSFKKPLNLEDE